MRFITEIPNTKLDVKLREAMEAAEKQLTDAERKLRTKEEVATTLEDQLRGLRRETESEIENKEKRIQELQQSLKVKKTITLYLYSGFLKNLNACACVMCHH